MPTIELVSVGCPVLPEFSEFQSFAIMAEAEVHSHRGLFEEQFLATSGVVVHVGNKELEGQVDGWWYAGTLIQWDSSSSSEPQKESDKERASRQDLEGRFHFEAEPWAEMQELLSMMRASSPAGEVWFSTDYQFGPAARLIRADFSKMRFIEEHDSIGLRWNALYKIGSE